MCGLHCLNSIVQGPMFDESSLFEIARQLDEEERKLLESAGVATNAAEGTNNIADDGNYNIQVLEKAIEGIGSYQLLPLNKPGVRTDDVAKDNEAFLCNSADHWFAIRKVHGKWFNLNSTNTEPGPQIVSDFYLDVFLQSIEDNYTIYTVKGDPLPQPKKVDDLSSLRESQRYLGLDYIEQDYELNKTRPLNTDGADQSEIDAAIKASLEDNYHPGVGVDPAPPPAPPLVAEDSSEDPELKAAIAMSLAMSEHKPDDSSPGPS